MSEKQRESIRRRLFEWYARHGRSTLPWRIVRDPYYTLVSEFMLQQTQVDRVIPKFLGFVERFPDIIALARASTADILREWKGLGYNSRAVRLKRLAEVVTDEHNGVVPRNMVALRGLPGIGAYTAAAVRAFAFDLDDAPIDTNIRRIIHRLYFGIEFPKRATPAELDAQAQALVPQGKAHDWNSALMDLGSSLCTARAPKCLLCPLREDCAAAPIEAAMLENLRTIHTKASGPQNAVPFEQTTRYARGRVIDRLRDLPPGCKISLLDLHRVLEPVLPGRTADDVRGFVKALERDGLVQCNGEHVALRD